MNHRFAYVLTAAVIVALAGCSAARSTQTASSTSPTPAAAAADDQPSAPSAGQPSPAARASEAVAAAESAGGVPTSAVAVADVADFGQLLIDGDGYTLYVFIADTDGVSTCNDACADSWPAAIGAAELAVGDDVDPALLGTAARDDGSEQLTYAGQPLYRYSGDQAPGDVLGSGIGDSWFAVDPDGEPIDEQERPEVGDGY